LFAPQTVVGKPTVVPLRSTVANYRLQLIFSLTAGFACNCKGFFATVSEANNCECNEQL